MSSGTGDRVTDGDADDRQWRRFGPDSLEREALLALSRHLGVVLRPRPIDVQPGTSVEVEGVDGDEQFLIQVVASRGEFTSRQRNKTLADLFKLIWLRDTRFGAARVGLILNDNTVAAFRPNAWPFVAARDLGVELWVLQRDGSVIELLARP